MDDDGFDGGVAGALEFFDMMKASLRECREDIGLSGDVRGNR